MMNHFDVEADAAAMRRSWHISLRVIREQREGREREKKKSSDVVEASRCWKKKREKKKKNFTAETHPGRLGLNKKNVINREEVYFEIKQEGGRWGGNEMNEGVNEGNLPDTAQ